MTTATATVTVRNAFSTERGTYRAIVDTDGTGFSTGYLVLYGVAFASSVLGSVFVTRIKGVR